MTAFRRGPTAEARQLRAFIEATADLEAAALDIEVDLRGVRFHPHCIPGI